MKNLELLSPAGNMDKAKIALAFGADAVYVGIPDFSLRVRINDFDKKGIKELLGYARGLKKKVYVTINIFAHNRHIKKLPPYIKFLKEIKVDALIISDPGIIAMVKEIWPKAEIHLSTQANCTNWQSAKFWYKQGVKRVILGRETTLNEIKEIKKQVPKLELEVFVHGAMCMAYSGRCFLSKYFVDRSGNLGDCVQPCRWNYFISEEKRPDHPLEIVEEEHGSYILNSKDLCLVEYLDKLARAGVESFKIEGRAKSVYYQAVVAHAYRRAISFIGKKNYKKESKELFNQLNTRLVHRGYFTGFLFGGEGDQEIENSRTNPDWEFCGQYLDCKSQDNKNKYLLKIKVHNTLKLGDQVEIVRPGMDILKFKLKKMVDAKNDKEISEAHGGAGGASVIIETEEEIPEYSVVRRKNK